MIKYPLSQNMKENLYSYTGKSFNDISIENVLNGNIKAEDIRISKETLRLQGKVAEESGRAPMKKNFLRASELIEVPDEIILEIYDKLRPNRSTKQELLSIARDLEEKYKAIECAKLVRKAVYIYEKRGILKLNNTF